MIAFILSSTTLPTRRCTLALLTFITLTFTLPAQAALRLSGIFGDHMVLQRHQPVTIWGWTNPGQTVSVQFDGQSLSATADDQGAWQARLQPMKANAVGRPLIVSADTNSLTIRDVLVGDIWHASGQSNMAMTLGVVARKLDSAKQDLADARIPTLRYRRIQEAHSPTPQDDLPVKGGWITSSPVKAAGFSAAAFYFARTLHQELDLPIALIDTSRGGTPIEPFIPRDAFHSHPTLQQELKLGDDNNLRAIWKLPGGVRARDGNWLPGRLFHSRIHPITRFATRGVIWYQGESNCGDGEDPRDYQHKMRALINGWRDALRNPTLPFYFVQLPGGGARESWPYLREQQRLSSDLPHTGMAVTIDLLDDDIHPLNKFDVGKRLARWALAQDYGRDITPSGPLFHRAEIAGGKVIVHFLYAENGLMLASKSGLADPVENSQLRLTQFELADRSGVWHPALATLTGKTVTVHRPKIAAPVAVRYGYAINPRDCHLYNRDGLPAAPFCSDPTLLNVTPNLPSD